ncbi:uncharacterized protein EDB91DRAFT_1088442 [Suillus paluster]|uniref:uncharacterized protein n=1 Tax=Suillus paluster TaxID=48578 RepID=UPI001B86024A|nr:uncharacterized protein EDB91DRAFT_1088442 [Suillus paluster]KAG1721477.1 hypothetical protein EDB91DRAFT_1088442 [Suillus paluster]
MSSGLDAVTASINAAFHQAGNKVKHLLGQALQLDAADPKHIPIAVEMAHTLTTSVPPIVLSAAAELQEHLDSSFCQVTIPAARPAPFTCSLLVMATRHLLQHLPLALLPRPKPKRQRAKSKSKAIITSDDDMELDNVAVPEPAPAPAQPLKGVLKRTRACVPNVVSGKEASYVEIDELDEEPMIVGPAPKMGRPYVEIPPTPMVSGKVAGPANGLEEDSHTDTTLPVISSIDTPRMCGVHDYHIQLQHSLLLCFQIHMKHYCRVDILRPCFLPSFVGVHKTIHARIKFPGNMDMLQTCAGVNGITFAEGYAILIEIIRGKYIWHHPGYAGQWQCVTTAADADTKLLVLILDVHPSSPHPGRYLPGRKCPLPDQFPASIFWHPLADPTSEVTEGARGKPKVPVPWSDIMKGQSRFISSTYLPDGTQIMEPSKMHRDEAISLLECWLDQQDNQVSLTFQFKAWIDDKGKMHPPVGKESDDSDGDANNKGVQPMLTKKSQTTAALSIKWPYISSADEESSNTNADVSLPKQVKKHAPNHVGTGANAELSDQVRHQSESDDQPPPMSLGKSVRVEPATILPRTDRAHQDRPIVDPGNYNSKPAAAGKTHMPTAQATEGSEDESCDSSATNTGYHSSQVHHAGQHAHGFSPHSTCWGLEHIHASPAVKVPAPNKTKTTGDVSLSVKARSLRKTRATTDASPAVKDQSLKKTRATRSAAYPLSDAPAKRTRSKVDDLLGTRPRQKPKRYADYVTQPYTLLEWGMSPAHFPHCQQKHMQWIINLALHVHQMLNPDNILTGFNQSIAHIPICQYQIPVGIHDISCRRDTINGRVSMLSSLRVAQRSKSLVVSNMSLSKPSLGAGDVSSEPRLKPIL